MSHDRKNVDTFYQLRCRLCRGKVGRQANEKDRATMTNIFKMLDKAVQLAEIASDWHLDEVEYPCPRC